MGSGGGHVEKSERTKERISRTAFELFEKNGFRKTTIPAICEAADVSRSTFFHYFKNKGAILSDYRFGFAEHLQTASENLPAGLSGKEKVRMLLLIDAEQNLERGAMLRQAIVCSLDNDPEFRESHDRTFSMLPPIYAHILKESNPGASDEYCERTALLIVRLYWIIWRSCILMRDPYDFKQELSNSLDLVWDGIDLD